MAMIDDSAQSLASRRDQAASASRITVGPAYTYTPFPGDGLDHITLYPWVGQHVAVSTIENTLSADVMTRVVNGLDAAYGVYVQITGREPIPYVRYDEKLSLAELPDNPSYTFAEHGYLGFTGIEFQTTYFKELYDDAAVGTYDQAPFYELGRNFWFYGDPLGVVDAFVTGYAVANRFVSMEVANLPGGPFGSYAFSDFKTAVVDGQTKQFLSDASYTLANTLGEGKPLSGPWSVNDLAGSFFYQVYENSSLEAYSRFYQLLEGMGKASTSTQAFANFISAATGSTGLDFSFLLKPSGTSFLTGGGDADHLSAAAAGTIVFGFGGNDVLQASASGSTLLGGSGNDALSGGSAADLLYGGLGADSLTGGAGNDRLDGGAGADTLSGGAGNDVYYIDTAKDRIVEAADGGIDTVYSSFNKALGANLENLSLTGAATTSATGNDGDNVLTGNAGNNYIRGNGGADTMIGGLGNDVYIVVDRSDRVIEQAASGNDAISCSFDGYVLPENVERLYLTGAARTVAGNAGDNLIEGTAGNDAISGLDGNDRLYGGTANDTLSGGAGSDRLYGGAGRDVLTGGAGADTFCFATGDTAATLAAADQINDFRRVDGDKIDLTAFDTDPGTAALDPFQRWLGTGAFTGAGGELHYAVSGQTTILSGDVDGDKIADLVIRLSGPIDLLASDLRFAAAAAPIEAMLGSGLHPVFASDLPG